MHARTTACAQDQWPYVDLTAVELQLSGDGPWELSHGLTAHHTPGHSRGSLCFLANAQLAGKEGVLFTGDHLAYSARRQRLDGFARYGWDIRLQAESILKLAHLPFQWILPGHGRRWRFDSAAERKLQVELAAEQFRQDPFGGR